MYPIFCKKDKCIVAAKDCMIGSCPYARRDEDPPKTFCHYSDAYETGGEDLIRILLVMPDKLSSEGFKCGGREVVSIRPQEESLQNLVGEDINIVPLSGGVVALNREGASKDDCLTGFVITGGSRGSDPGVDPIYGNCVFCRVGPEGLETLSEKDISMIDQYFVGA